MVVENTEKADRRTYGILDVTRQQQVGLARSLGSGAVNRRRQLTAQKSVCFTVRKNFS